MKEIRKFLLTLIFGLLALFSTAIISNASSSDLYLNKLNFDVQINTDGSMDVTETWDIDVEDTNTLFKTFEMDKTRFSNITNVEVSEIQSDGTEKDFKEISELMYHVTKNCYYGLINDDGDFEIAWGVGLDSDSDTRTYKISYTVKDAIKNCEDCSELYWQFVGKDFEVDAKKITGTITLPYETNNKSNLKVWGHTEDLNGEINVTATDEVKFEINQFRSGRYVEVRIAIPTEVSIHSGRQDTEISLQNIIDEETIWANEANARRERKQLIIKIITIICIIVAILLCIYLIERIIKNYKGYKNLPEKLKPSKKIIYYRDLPDENATPGEALRMINAKITDLMSDDIGKIFSATLLDLSLKGLIKFETEDVKFKNKNLTIIMENIDISLLKDKQDELAIYEFLQDACSRTDGRITIKELEKYIKRNESKVLKLKSTLDSTTEKNIINKKYVDSQNKRLQDKHSTGWLGYIMLLLFLIPVIIVMGILMSSQLDNIVIRTLAIISSIVAIALCIINIVMKSLTISKINVFTQDGIDKTNEWKGLKKFMQEFSMLDKREVPEIVIWEKYLVYATAFGIADKVLEQLKMVYPNFEEIADINTGVYIGLMMNTDFTSSFSNSISSAMSASYSSGSGGGGGFSGGGGRWPAEVAGGGGR